MRISLYIRRNINEDIIDNLILMSLHSLLALGNPDPVLVFYMDFEDKLQADTAGRQKAHRQIKEMNP